MSSTRRAAASKLRTTLDQVADPILVLDPRRRVLYANRAWEELTGLSLEAALGQPCELAGGADNGEIAAALSCFGPPPEALEGRPTSTSILMLKTDGPRQRRRIEFWPLRDDRGQIKAIWCLVLAPGSALKAPESEVLRLRGDLEELRARQRERHGYDTLIGCGAGHRRCLDQIAAAATTRVPVLIVGEPGTGRRLVARTIHHTGPRPTAPFVAYDCAALPPEVLARELFLTEPEPGLRGLERTRPPEDATLLLVEIAELGRDIQARLANALSAGARLIATSVTEPEVRGGRDRWVSDLAFALTTFVIRLAPLRDRLDEVPLLAQAFLERANARSERRRIGFTPEAIKVLMSYDWPGNVRELARVIDAAHERAAGDLIDADDLPSAIKGHLGGAYLPPTPTLPRTSLDDALTQVERRLIERALRHAGHNKSRAAELLDISRPRLYRRMKELNVPDEPESSDDAPLASQRVST